MINRQSNAFRTTNYKASFLPLLTWEGIFHVLFVSFFYPVDFLVKENYVKSCQLQMFRPPRARCLLPGKRQTEILRSACRTISKAAARSGGCTNEKICDFVRKLKSLNFSRFSSANFEPSPPYHFTCASVNTRVIFVARWRLDIKSYQHCKQKIARLELMIHT